MGNRRAVGQDPLNVSAGGVPAAQLGPALLWLSDEGRVAIDRLAGVFGLTAGHVRQLLYRERRERQSQWPQAADEADRPPSEKRVRLGLRPDEDSTPPLSQRDRRVDELLAEVDAISAEGVTSGQFLAATRRLRRLRQFRGYPSNRAWLRFIARVYRERAWFFVHLGHTASAIADAKSAIEASRLAYGLARTTSAEREDQADIGTTALIVSQGHLLRQRPKWALRALELVEDAADTGPGSLGSDYWRQRGVALLQLEEADSVAQKYFDKSARIMEELGEFSRREELQYTGNRHVYLMTKDWERASELAHDIADSTAFGPSSLHASVATHWAVACALSGDSPSAHQDAFSLLEANAPTARAFGHQLTLYTLFGRTLELGLTSTQRTAWVRHLLYLNAFRNR